MAKSIIDMLKETIDVQYHLQAGNGCWQMKDDVTLLTNGADSVGFSLDVNELQTDAKPLAVFGANATKGLTRMCDAIVALMVWDRLFMVSIEKTGGSSSDFRQQLANGKMFLDWIIALSVYHDYHDGDNIEHIGLLVKGGRSRKRKGTTTHPPPVLIKHDAFARCYDAKNARIIDLLELAGG